MKLMIGCALMVLAAVAGCDNTKSKVEAAVDKADKAVDKVQKQLDESGPMLTTARAAIADGRDPLEQCTWSASHPEAVELKRICGFDVPMRHATMAVTAAEKARAEMPEAPSLTECQSDGWTKAKAALDRDFATDAAWTALAARWTKVCPGA